MWTRRHDYHCHLNKTSHLYFFIIITTILMHRLDIHHNHLNLNTMCKYSVIIIVSPIFTSLKRNPSSRAYILHHQIGIKSQIQDLTVHHSPSAIDHPLCMCHEPSLIICHLSFIILHPPHHHRALHIIHN